MYSEEVQEARNKHNRQYRLSHSRKRPEKTQCRISLINYLLVSSDPVITSIIEFDISQLLRDVSEGEASGIQMTMMTIIPCRIRICGQVVSVGRSTGDRREIVSHLRPRTSLRIDFISLIICCVVYGCQFVKNEEA